MAETDTAAQNPVRTLLQIRLDTATVTQVS